MDEWNPDALPTGEPENERSALSVRANESSALLASDAERERVANLLGEAAGEGRLTLAEFSDRAGRAYASRTRGELEPLLADLPAGIGSVAPTTVPAVRLPVVGNAVAVQQVTPIGAIKRSGRWRLDRDTSLKVTVGPVKLDLRGAEIAAQDVNLHVETVLGAVKVWIPTGVRVLVDGTTSIGTRTIEEDTPRGPGPVLRLHIDTTIGSVKVYRV
jgi:hypothetical protein